MGRIGALVALRGGALTEIAPGSLVLLALLMLLTLYSTMVTGIFEPESFDVAHFDAGAGNDLLLLRGFLTLTLILLFAYRFFSLDGLANRLASLLLVLTVTLTFYGSCRWIERWAPEYSEQDFMELWEMDRAGEELTTKDVQARLGKPLFVKRTALGIEIWSYSYMPSGGFGWDKRIVRFFDGRVTSMYAIDEP